MFVRDWRILQEVKFATFYGLVGPVDQTFTVELASYTLIRSISWHLWSINPKEFHWDSCGSGTVVISKPNHVGLAPGCTACITMSKTRAGRASVLWGMLWFSICFSDTE